MSLTTFSPLLTSLYPARDGPHPDATPVPSSCWGAADHATNAPDAPAAPCTAPGRDGRGDRGARRSGLEAFGSVLGPDSRELGVDIRHQTVAGHDSRVRTA